MVTCLVKILDGVKLKISSLLKVKKISMTVFNTDMDISDKEIKHYKLVHFVRRCRINDHAEFT